MEQKQFQYSPHILAVSLGAIGGGLLVATITRAIPKMMSKMMV